MDALDALAQGQDPILRVSVLHYVAGVEMGAYPWAVELIYERSHLERAQQKLVPHILGIQQNLGARRVWDDLGQLRAVAIPSVLGPDLEFGPVTEADSVEEQCAALQVRGNRDCPANRLDAACPHQRIGVVQRILVERFGNPEGGDPDAGLLGRVRHTAGVIVADIEGEIGAYGNHDGLEPGRLGLGETLGPRHFLGEYYGTDSFREAGTGLRAGGKGRGQGQGKNLTAVHLAHSMTQWTDLGKARLSRRRRLTILRRDRSR